MKNIGLQASLALGLSLWCVAGSGGADGEHKPFIPTNAYKDLLAREVRILDQNLTGSPGDEQQTRAKLAAVLIARYALDAETKGTAPVEHAALKLAKMLGTKDKIGDARKLAASLPATKDGAGTLEPVDAKAYLGEVMDTMNLLRPKKKGGDGIHADLQTSGPLKALNGIEEKIRSLAKKKLSATALGKSANEMVLLGYRMAVLAEVINDFAPAAKTKEWRDLSHDMRTAGISLAHAAKKRDAAAIFAAGTRLDTTCNQCHTAFRK